MKVLVKSWKNATEPHDKGSKTNENACIKFQCTFICLNQTKTHKVHYSLHLRLWWRWILMTPCAKNPSLIELLASVSSIHRTDGTPNRSSRGMLKEKAHYKNSELLGFSTLNPQANDVRGGSNVLQVHNRQTKVTLFFNGIIGLSLCKRFNMFVQLRFSNFLRELA